MERVVRVRDLKQLPSGFEVFLELRDLLPLFVPEGQAWEACSELRAVAAQAAAVASIMWLDGEAAPQARQRVRVDTFALSLSC